MEEVQPVSLMCSRNQGRRIECWFLTLMAIGFLTPPPQKWDRDTCHVLPGGHQFEAILHSTSPAPRTNTLQIIPFRGSVNGEATLHSQPWVWVACPGFSAGGERACMGAGLTAERLSISQDPQDEYRQKPKQNALLQGRVQLSLVVGWK